MVQLSPSHVLPGIVSNPDRASTVPLLTAKHLFYSGEQGWVAAGELRVGDQVRRADGGYGMVSTLTVPRRGCGHPVPVAQYLVIPMPSTDIRT